MAIFDAVPSPTKLGIWLLSFFTQSPFRQIPLQASFHRGGCEHSPKDRSCWKDGFNIKTDYEIVAPPGKLVEYDFTISNGVISPDGHLFNATIINGQFPGPTIEADWGDTIRITVHNNLTNQNGTAFHWHGIRQFQTNYLDGVPGLTQCPSKPGDTQVYEFVAMQYGTGWYHSHYSLQYSNGALGPLHIRGPSSMNYDVDLGPMLISDWYHDDAFSMFHYEVTHHAPIPVGTIVNGKAIRTCDSSKDDLCLEKLSKGYEVAFEFGKTYKIGIINTASLTTYKFWIDGHNFTVIQTDFVPIKPYVTDVLILGIAQRYEIVIEANATFAHGTNFWIHAVYCDDESPFDDMLGSSEVAIIRYNQSDTSDPYTPPENATHHNFLGCRDPAPTDLVPIVERQVGKDVNGINPGEWLKIGLQAWPNMSDPNSAIKKWVLANRTQYLDWRDPPLARFALDSKAPVAADESPIYLDYDTGDWVYFVIEGNYTAPAPTPRVIPRSVHPIHLHGHDFVILAQGDGPFHRDVTPQLDNPARRDTVNVPIGGYVWIAFQVNNPGTWLMHCHIAWHASAGLSLQFVEQRAKIPALIEQAGILPEMNSRCREWTEHYETFSIPEGKFQEDSGI